MSGYQAKANFLNLLIFCGLISGYPDNLNIHTILNPHALRYFPA